MSIQKMKRVRIIGLRSEKDAFLNDLLRFGKVEISDYPQAEGDVVVRVANPDGREATDFRQPVLQLTAKPASVDFQNWRVSYDGEEDHWRSFSFRYDSGTGVVSAFYSGGTMVIFR